MLQWILSMFFGCIVLSHVIHVQGSAVPKWKSNVNRQLFDDCHLCHARNRDLERRIQTLEANIREYVLDTSLQERLLLTPTQANITTSLDQGGSHVVPFPVRSKREDLETEYSGCVPYPDYVNSGQCVICGGHNAFNELSWQETCHGRCQQEINGLCKNVTNGSTPVCLEETICIDCSDVSVHTSP